MKKQIASALLALTIITSPIWAEAEYFITSDIGSSAEMIGQGNIEGFSDKANSVFDNAAGLYRINAFSTNLFTTTLMNEVSYKNLTIAMRFNEGVLGLGYMSTDVTGLVSTTQNIETTEIDPTGQTFGYNNTSIKASYQWSQSEHLHWGTSLTYYSTSIGDITGTGTNADLGMILDFYPIVLSFSAKNILAGKVKYSNGNTENLPLQTTYGAQYTLGEFEVAGQFKSRGSNFNITKAGSITYRPDALPFLQLSAGYKEFFVQKDIQNNYTLGFGLNLNSVNFNYAYESSKHIEYNSKHYFSVGLSF
jgi:hypothetical protein